MYSAHEREHLAPARRGADELGAAVGRVGDALDVAVGLEVGDELRHRLLGHLRAGGEHADARAGVVEELQHVAVRVADLAVAVRRQPLDQLLAERAERLAQQDRDVLGPLAGGGLREA